MYTKITLVISAILLSGCATVTRGITDQVQIHSNPDGAKASTSLGQSCTTPCTITVNRKDEFTVHYQKEGYAPQDVDVKTQIAGTGAAGFAGNIILGGVIGMSTDVATGATLDHVPNPVNASLVPAGKSLARNSRRTGQPGS